MAMTCQNACKANHLISGAGVPWRGALSGIRGTEGIAVGLDRLGQQVEEREDLLVGQLKALCPVA